MVKHVFTYRYSTYSIKMAKIYMALATKQYCLVIPYPTWVLGLHRLVCCGPLKTCGRSDVFPELYNTPKRSTNCNNYQQPLPFNMHSDVSQPLRAHMQGETFYRAMLATSLPRRTMSNAPFGSQSYENVNVDRFRWCPMRQTSDPTPNCFLITVH